jgi:hypothetical protein
MKKNTEKLLADAVIDLVDSHSLLINLFGQQKQHNEILYSFMERVFEWRGIKSKNQFLKEVFGEVIDMTPAGFITSFRNFVENFILGDSAFRVEWYKNNVLSDVNDSGTEPVIIRDNDGVQSVFVLMQIMDIKALRCAHKE